MLFGRHFPAFGSTAQNHTLFSVSDLITMAELLGVVASGIAVVQVAAEVGDRALALKRLWDEIKDVPETITSLVSQIEVLTPILDQINIDFSQFSLRPGSIIWNDKGAQICASHCRRAKEELSRLAEDLSAHVDSTKRSRRGIAKIKVVMKKETLAKYETRLSRSLQLLSLANTCYLRSKSNEPVEALGC